MSPGSVRNRVWLSLLCLGISLDLPGQDLSKAHERWIERDVVAIATRDEVQLFRALPGDADRDRFQEIFWLRRDPDLGTPANEFRQAYEERIGVANDRLQGRGRPGFLTDMGQVFLLFGFPSRSSSGRTGNVSVPERSSSPSQEIEGSTTEAAPAGQSGAPATARSQTWLYDAEPALGLPNGLEVRFRARPGIGYRLVESEELDEILESRRAGLVASPDIGYDLDSNGNLLPPSLPSDATRATELLDALLAGAEPEDAIGFELSTYFFRSTDGETYVPILFEVPVEALGMSETNELDLTFYGALTDAQGGLAARFEERVWPGAIDPAGEPVERVSFEMPLQLAPGNYTVHVGVLDEISDVHGSRVWAVRIPGYPPEDVTLSSVLLFRSASQSPGPSGVPGRALQFGSIKFEPAGTRSFTRDDTLGLFYYVYGASGTELNARYIFFQDGVEKAQTRPQSLAASEGLAAGSDEIPLAGFAPGEYRVIVHVVDAISGEIFQTAAEFTLR